MKPNSADQDETEHDAELLRRHREHEVGMAVGQDALDRPLARPAAEPAAANERLDRGVDLKGVAGRRIEEALDAAASHGEWCIGGGEPGTAVPPRPITQMNRIPAMKKSAPQTSATAWSARNRAAAPECR